MINKPYVLFSRIPIVITSGNRIFCNRLWAKDLKLHLNYISNFKLCCPVSYSDTTEQLEDITDYQINFIHKLRQSKGILSVVMNILPDFLTVIEACKGAAIVHSGGAGWPFPPSFYILVVKPFFSFQWVMVIESSSWMLEPQEKRTLRKVVNQYICQTILPICVRKADARIFTQSFYRQFFLNGETARTLVAPATWVDREFILSEEQSKQRFLQRKGRPLEIIFPARLVEDKGVSTLFEAINILKDLDAELAITIMGSGDLEEDCQKFCLGNYGAVKVNYHEPVEYGKAFFDILGNYDAVLVLNLKQEQPRILFDAFSQGIGAIASDTSGILDITSSNNTIHFKAGDSQELAKSIYLLAKNPDMAVKMGQNGLEYVKDFTHHNMHLQREQFFESVLNM